MSAHTDHTAIIAAPVDLVWRAANDLEYWPMLFDGEYTRAEILDLEPSRVRFRLTTCPDRQGRTYTWVSERYPDSDHYRVTARRVETGPFLYMHIFQSFESVVGGTRVRWIQDFEMKPESSMTDEEMAALIDQRARANLSSHKRVIESLAGGRSFFGRSER
jgi:aromatase